MQISVHRYNRSISLPRSNKVNTFSGQVLSCQNILVFLKRSNEVKYLAVYLTQINGQQIKLFLISKISFFCLEDLNR